LLHPLPRKNQSALWGRGVKCHREYIQPMLAEGLIEKNPRRKRYVPTEEGAAVLDMFS